MKLDVKNLPSLKVAHHLEHVAAMCALLADQLDTMLLDLDGADDYTDLVSELTLVSESAANASADLMASLD